MPLLSGLLDSVQFAPNATSVVVPFGQRSHLRVWRPRSAVDDSTLSELPSEQNLHLRKALNGLRKASQEWICFVAEVVKKHWFRLAQLLSGVLPLFRLVGVRTVRTAGVC